MIPAIGTIISAYVGFRILELLLQSTTRHSSSVVQGIVLLAGAVALLTIGASWADLMSNGSSLPAAFGH